MTLSTALASGTVHVLHRVSKGVSRDAAASTVAASTGPARAKYLVLMVLDGGRPDYLNLPNLPHVRALMDGGTLFTHAFAGILEAETPAGHATIATGSLPSKTGILGFDWGNDDDRYSLFNPDKMTALEQILAESHVPTIAGLFKQAHPGATVVAVSGHKYYAAAPLGGPDADAIMYYEGDAKGRYVPVAVPGHEPPVGVLTAPGVTAYSTHNGANGEDSLATRLAISSFQRMHQRITLINYPHFDWPLGHVNGGDLDPAALTEVMQGFDADLGAVEDAYRRAGVLDQTEFVITSDHGMMPITHFVPPNVATDAIQASGTSASDIASNSGDYIWLTDPSKSQDVATRIMTAHDPEIEAVYYLTEVEGTVQYEPAPGLTIGSAIETANQTLLATMLNGHEPAVVVFGTEGTSFTDPSSGWKADHGGQTWESQHVPLLISGPGIRHGIVSDAPAELEDVAPTALADLGVAATGMQGIVLTEALTQPTVSARALRAARRAELQPVVRALRGQSRLYPAAAQDG
jgi:predicted AlkP superfamily pyrophosphatase or phosphodiesterase